jgi:predicted acyltransferase
MKTYPTQRLESLDILRGLDLFLLVFLQPILMANRKYLG